MANSDDEWVPPSEGEIKIREARRERQDKISKLMGQYLLKGYKMLDAVCATCQTVLLRTKATGRSEGVDYCVTCSEMDTDVSKDDPVLDPVAARSAVLENQLKSDASKTTITITPTTATIIIPNNTITPTDTITPTTATINTTSNTSNTDNITDSSTTSPNNIAPIINNYNYYYCASCHGPTSDTLNHAPNTPHQIFTHPNQQQLSSQQQQPSCSQQPIQQPFTHQHQFCHYKSTSSDYYIQRPFFKNQLMNSLDHVNSRIFSLTDNHKYGKDHAEEKATVELINSLLVMNQSLLSLHAHASVKKE